MCGRFLCGFQASPYLAFRYFKWPPDGLSVTSLACRLVGLGGRNENHVHVRRWCRTDNREKRRARCRIRQGRSTCGQRPVRPLRPKGIPAVKFMIMRKADADTEAGVMPSMELVTAMTSYNEAMATAGVL
jgi:hypothetical protein